MHWLSMWGSRVSLNFLIVFSTGSSIIQWPRISVLKIAPKSQGKFQFSTLRWRHFILRVMNVAFVGYVGKGFGLVHHGVRGPLDATAPLLSRQMQRRGWKECKWLEWACCSRSLTMSVHILALLLNGFQELDDYLMMWLACGWSDRIFNIESVTWMLFISMLSYEVRICCPSLAKIFCPPILFPSIL